MRILYIIVDTDNIQYGERTSLKNRVMIHPICSTFKEEKYAFIFNGNIPFISPSFKRDTEFIKNFIETNNILILGQFYLNLFAGS